MTRSLATSLALAFLFATRARLVAQDAPDPAPAQEIRRQDSKPETEFEETVVVTAERRDQALESVISHTSVLSTLELQTSPAVVLDDSLRRVPGFSLFRRSSSLVAHPTTQGATLRGIGPSGAGRSLVLLDGLPLNDPFGGWVYWNRIPVAALRSVEVVRGATSPLYGSSALSGTIQLLSRQTGPEGVLVSAMGGSLSTYALDASVVEALGEWSIDLSGRIFDTAGYVVLAPDEQGPIDEPTRFAHQTLSGHVGRGPLSMGFNFYWEQRGNGTPLQTNATDLQMVDLAYRGARWNARGYAQLGRFESRFSRVAADRVLEVLTAQQSIDSLGAGGSLSWQNDSGLMTGVDWRYVRALDHDQLLGGVFVQDRLSVARDLDVLLGLRLDVWENQATQASVNPRLGALWRASRHITLRTSAYRGFRAPTLNELYRPFQVGQVRTLANPDLTEEWLWGAELGTDIAVSRRVVVRINGFWSELKGAIGNATLLVEDSSILRERQNLSAATVRGIELDADVSLPGRCRATASYLLTDSRLDDGRWLPQVPKHQATIALRHDGIVSTVFDVRLGSAQFEDDRNELLLERFVVFGASIRKGISRNLELFVSAENLTDERYAVGRTPLLSLGAPRMVHGGITARFSR
jgi:outer membrane cobalamin receptor